MKLLFVPTPIPYTGNALASHWAYRNFGILGDSIVAFMGPCQVDETAMVDLEDVLNHDAIYSKHMLHFIIELFGPSLREGVLVQRLFSSIVQNRINADQAAFDIQRRGDDLFYQDVLKLSVSICTVSPVSVLIHTGLNIDAADAPVQAAGLHSELAWEDTPQRIEPFASACMRTLLEEWEDIHRSCCKVRPVYSS
jgi:hypothetical protein